MSAEPDRRSAALAAIAAASAGLIDLAQFVRDGDPLGITEVLENLADACRLTIVARGVDDELTNQLAGALDRFLEGWA